MFKIKKFKPKVSDLIFLVILAFLLMNRLPGIIESYKIEGTEVPNLQLHYLSNEQKTISQISGPKILIFWASWCGPCKVEMNRFNDAIKKEELPRDKVLFVNMGETDIIIKKFLKKENYQITVVRDPYRKLADKLKVVSTPTVFYINDKNTIEHVSSGISPLGIYRGIWLFP